MIRAYFDATVRFLKEEDGPTAIEYAVVLSLIIGVSLAAVGHLATAVGDSFNSSNDAISNAFGN
jgi:pilus assembly protein Flp/PilA